MCSSRPGRSQLGEDEIDDARDGEGGGGDQQDVRERVQCGLGSVPRMVRSLITAARASFEHGGGHDGRDDYDQPDGGSGHGNHGRTEDRVAEDDGRADRPDGRRDPVVSEHRVRSFRHRMPEPGPLPGAGDGVVMARTIRSISPARGFGRPVAPWKNRWKARS